MRRIGKAIVLLLAVLAFLVGFFVARSFGFEIPPVFVSDQERIVKLNTQGASPRLIPATPGYPDVPDSVKGAGYDNYWASEYPSYRLYQSLSPDQFTIPRITDGQMEEFIGFGVNNTIKANIYHPANQFYGLLVKGYNTWTQLVDHKVQVCINLTDITEADNIYHIGLYCIGYKEACYDDGRNIVCPNISSANEVMPESYYQNHMAKYGAKYTPPNLHLQWTPIGDRPGYDKLLVSNGSLSLPLGLPNIQVSYLYRADNQSAPPYWAPSSSAGGIIWKIPMWIGVGMYSHGGLTLDNYYYGNAIGLANLQWQATGDIKLFPSIVPWALFDDTGLYNYYGFLNNYLTGNPIEVPQNINMAWHLGDHNDYIGPVIVPSSQYLFDNGHDVNWEVAPVPGSEGFPLVGGGMGIRLPQITIYSGSIATTTTAMDVPIGTVSLGFDNLFVANVAQSDIQTIPSTDNPADYEVCSSIWDLKCQLNNAVIYIIYNNKFAKLFRDHIVTPWNDIVAPMINNLKSMGSSLGWIFILFGFALLVCIVFLLLK